MKTSTPFSSVMTLPAGTWTASHSLISSTRSIRFCSFRSVGPIPRFGASALWPSRFLRPERPAARDLDAQIGLWFLGGQLLIWVTALSDKRDRSRVVLCLRGLFLVRSVGRG